MHLEGNIGRTSGGGFFFQNAFNFALVNITFKNNFSRFGGGQRFLDCKDILVENSTFIDN